MVGPAGLEPATFRPPDGRATRLRHGPTWGLSYRKCGAGQGVKRMRWLDDSARRNAVAQNLHPVEQRGNVLRARGEFVVRRFVQQMKQARGGFAVAV